MQVKSIAEGEHSAIFSTFIKPPFSIKTFLLSFLSGRLRQYHITISNPCPADKIYSSHTE